MFSTIYASMMAGLLVKIWQSHGINYIHILEITYAERLNPYQLWKPAAVCAFILISTYWIFFEHASTIYEEY